MGFLNVLREFVHPDPRAVRRWNGDPLVIVDLANEVVFAGQIQIEATPLGEDTYDLTTLPDENQPLFILKGATRIPDENSLTGTGIYGYQTLQKGSRAGDVFEGADANGEGSTWYLGRSADNYLLENSNP